MALTTADRTAQAAHLLELYPADVLPYVETLEAEAAVVAASVTKSIAAAQLVALDAALAKAARVIMRGARYKGDGVDDDPDRTQAKLRELVATILRMYTFRLGLFVVGE